MRAGDLPIEAPESGDQVRRRDALLVIGAEIDPERVLSDGQQAGVIRVDLPGPGKGRFQAARVHSEDVVRRVADDRPAEDRAGPHRVRLDIRALEEVRGRQGSAGPVAVSSHLGLPRAAPAVSAQIGPRRPGPLDVGPVGEQLGGRDRAERERRRRQHSRGQIGVRDRGGRQPVDHQSALPTRQALRDQLRVRGGGEAG